MRARGQSTLPYARNNQTPSSSTSSLSRQTTKREEPPVFKEVILLPKPEFAEVPKYKRKSELHKHGYILDSVPIERCWSESHLIERIWAVFENKLKTSSGIPDIE